MGDRLQGINANEILCSAIQSIRYFYRPSLGVSRGFYSRFEASRTALLNPSTVATTEPIDSLSFLNE